MVLGHLQLNQRVRVRRGENKLPWTAGYKSESIEHNDPARGLFTFILIVKNRNGYPPFKDQNTALGSLAWYVLPSNDLVREPLHSYIPTQHLHALLVGNHLWLWVWTPWPISFYFYIYGSCWTHWHHFLSFLVIFCKLCSGLIMYLFPTELDGLIWLPLSQHYLNQREF